LYVLVVPRKFGQCGRYFELLAVPAIVYGYGTDEDEMPIKETVELLDKIVKEYIAGMVRVQTQCSVPLTPLHGYE
jgi:hypothetical protein